MVLATGSKKGTEFRALNIIAWVERDELFWNTNMAAIWRTMGSNQASTKKREKEKTHILKNGGAQKVFRLFAFFWRTKTGQMFLLLKCFNCDTAAG